MLQLPGAPAFSSFRIKKLLERIQREVTGLTGLGAHFVHFVELEQELTAEQTAILQQLLAPLSEPPAGALHSFWVVPRIGTISPWSSKATDIAHSCGLASVRRIERGIRYDLDLRHDAELVIKSEPGKGSEFCCRFPPQRLLLAEPAVLS